MTAVEFGTPPSNRREDKLAAVRAKWIATFDALHGRPGEWAKLPAASPNTVHVWRTRFGAPVEIRSHRLPNGSREVWARWVE